MDRIKKRSYDSPSQDDSKASKKRRTSDEFGEGSKNRDKKEESHHSKSRKHRSGKEKKSEKKHKSKGSKYGRHSKHKYTELSNDDYYSKNHEFATWLKEEKKQFFSDLSADSARKLFSDFVEAWNSEKLRSKYYKGIESAPRSSHTWKLKD